jgi:pimeloyl-ACP methyl ester carboxylesterase
MHGFPDDHRIYDKLMARLSPRRAVAFDFVGYGRSDRTGLTDFSIAAHESQITALLDALHTDRAVLVGHDASGPDALASVRAWTAGLHEALDQQDEVVNSGALAHLKVPVSIIWGLTDRYLNPSLADEIAALFEKPSLHLLPDAGHYPQHD